MNHIFILTSVTGKPGELVLEREKSCCVCLLQQQFYEGKDFLLACKHVGDQQGWKFALFAVVCFDVAGW
jgi:hypothetical protein